MFRFLSLSSPTNGCKIPRAMGEIYDFLAVALCCSMAGSSAYLSHDLVQRSSHPAWPNVLPFYCLRNLACTKRLLLLIASNRSIARQAMNFSELTHSTRFSLHAFSLTVSRGNPRTSFASTAHRAVLSLRVKALHPQTLAVSFSRIDNVRKCSHLCL